VAVRQYHVTKVLGSFQDLREWLPRLTEEEVVAALELEAATRRRRSVITRLIQRAVRLRETHYANQLKEKYDGAYQERTDP